MSAPKIYFQIYFQIELYNIEVLHGDVLAYIGHCLIVVHYFNPVQIWKMQDSFRCVCVNICLFIKCLDGDAESLLHW